MYNDTFRHGQKTIGVYAQFWAFPSSSAPLAILNDIVALAQLADVEDFPSPAHCKSGFAPVPGRRRSHPTSPGHIVHTPLSAFDLPRRSSTGIPHHQPGTRSRNLSSDQVFLDQGDETWPRTQAGLPLSWRAADRLPRPIAVDVVVREFNNPLPWSLRTTREPGMKRNHSSA